MLWGNVYTAVEPADRPAVEGEVVEHGFVSQWSEKRVLLDKGLTIEDALAAVVESQAQCIAVHKAGCRNPFQFILLFHSFSQED